MRYHVIIVGAGHAGCEAAVSLAKRNIQTVLITGNLKNMASLPCNPSIGGPAKGILVREIDALGGIMGTMADKCQIQIKMLNSGNGEAVRALRAQIDKQYYPRLMKRKLKKYKCLTLLEGLVDKLTIVNGEVRGVVLADGTNIDSKYVLLSTGTYLNSRCLTGNEEKISGPDNEPTTFGLSEQLKELGFEVIRLKTGTPPRILTKSIDFSKAEIQPGDKKIDYFSHYAWKGFGRGNLPCYLTRTNELTHQVILENLDKSAMYGGLINGKGPRYCPSIEDKVVRFSSKDSHQIFFEPEGNNLDTTYIQGFSTSMPRDIQEKMIRTIPGLENAVVVKYAYAIEYDAINPLEIYATLETKKIKNLYFAGQINGTSGYEEAACQGLMAGINIGNAFFGYNPFILRRDEAYIGVLIDDLILKGTTEPYRLLTSRAEYRLLLRHDNALYRLTEYGYRYGLIDERHYNAFKKKNHLLVKYLKKSKEMNINPSESINTLLMKYNSSPISSPTTVYTLMKRPELNDKILRKFIECDFSDEFFEELTIQIKYDDYIKKDLAEINQLKKMEKMRIPKDIDYDQINNMSSEAKEKLKKILPSTIGQASRISGVNPVDIAVLVKYIERR